MITPESENNICKIWKELFLLFSNPTICWLTEIFYQLHWFCSKIYTFINLITPKSDIFKIWKELFILFAIQQLVDQQCLCQCQCKIWKERFILFSNPTICWSAVPPLKSLACGRSQLTSRHSHNPPDFKRLWEMLKLEG